VRRKLHLLFFAGPILALMTDSASAQQAVQLPLFEGALLLRGEVGVTRDERSADQVSMSFWRPVLFGPADRPIGGRMDCELAGVTEPFSEELFDVEARYEASLPRRKKAGLRDETVNAGGAGIIRNLEVTGSANKPHRHFVLTYLAMRAGPTLYDLRMNCEFKHFQNPGDTDYAAIMHRYVDIAVPGIAAPTAEEQGQ